jgi:predicted dehydrogenase
MEMRGDDTSIATVKFENGAVGVLVESFIMKSEVTAGDAEVHWMRVDGDLGSLTVSHDDTQVRIYSEKPGVCKVVDGRPRESVVMLKGDSFQAEIAHFIECVRAGQEPLTSGRRQRKPLELVQAAYESIRSGRTVSV